MSLRLSDAIRSLKGTASFDNNEPAPDSPSFEIGLPSNTNRLTRTALKLSEIKVGDRIRQYLDSEKTESLVRSIKRHGFRGVLWVRQVQGTYYLVAGGRRYAACQIAGITEVPVEIWDITDAEAIQLELLENFQREDLNPIEETEGVLRMLEVTLNLPREPVLALFNWARSANYQPELQVWDTGIPNSKDAENAAQWQMVEEVFALIGKFTPESFRTNRLPLLKLPESILKSIESGQIEYSKARLIARIKDEEAQEKLLERAISEGLSRGAIAEAVSQIQANQRNNHSNAPQHHIYHRASNMAKRLRFATLENRSLKRVEKLLSELEALLEE